MGKLNRPNYLKTDNVLYQRTLITYFWEKHRCRVPDITYYCYLFLNAFYTGDYHPVRLQYLSILLDLYQSP